MRRFPQRIPFLLEVSRQDQTSASVVIFAKPGILSRPSPAPPETTDPLAGPQDEAPLCRRPQHCPFTTLTHRPRNLHPPQQTKAHLSLANKDVAPPRCAPPVAFLQHNETHSARAPTPRPSCNSRRNWRSYRAGNALKTKPGAGSSALLLRDQLDSARFTS